MSVNLQQIVNTDTFGVWIDRTNDIVEALEDVVSLGSTDQANANGDVVINGFVRASAGLQSDTLSPISGGGNIVLESNVIMRGDLVVDNDNTGQATQISFQDGGSTVWRIRSNLGADTFDIETPDNAHTLRIDATSNLITAIGLTIDPGIVTNLNASSVTAGSFATARIPNLSASKITSGTFAVGRIPQLPASRIDAGTLTGDFIIDNGSMRIDNNNDGSVLLRLEDTSAAANNKVMMQIAGPGNPLEVINWNDEGDYLITAGSTGIVIHDGPVGLHFVHRSGSDTQGFNLPLTDGYPLDEGPLSIQDVDGNVQVCIRAETRISAPVLFTEDVTIDSGARISGNGAVPVGAVQGFLMRTAPSGWLVLNGSAIPNGVQTVQGVTADFSELYATLVGVYGANGGQPIDLPDMRGLFPRAWDNGPGSLTADIGQTQQDQIAAHTHTISGAVIADEDTPNAAISNNVNNAEFPATGTTGSTGGNETRPKNISLLYCIKY